MIHKGERRELDPGSYCPDCGGDQRRVGDDMSEMFDLVAAQLKVLPRAIAEPVQNAV